MYIYIEIYIFGCTQPGQEEGVSSLATQQFFANCQPIQPCLSDYRDDPLETMTRYGLLRPFARRKPRAQLTACARAWQLLLDMTFKNNKLLHTKNEQPVKIK